MGISLYYSDTMFWKIYWFLGIHEFWIHVFNMCFVIGMSVCTKHHFYILSLKRQTVGYYTVNWFFHLTVQRTVSDFAARCQGILQEAMKWAPEATRSHLQNYQTHIDQSNLTSHSGLALATQSVMQYAGLGTPTHISHVSFWGFTASDGFLSEGLCVHCIP